MGMFKSVLILLLLAQIFLVVQTMAARSISGSNPFHDVSVRIRTGSISSPDTPISSTAAEQPSASESSSSTSEGIAEAPTVMRVEKHHTTADKSVAGGGVIIGGLVTAIFAAVYCYIRVTRERVPANH